MIRILAIGRFSGMDCTQDLWVWWIHPEQKTFVPIRSKTHDLNKNKPNNNLILDKYHNCQEQTKGWWYQNTLSHFSCNGEILQSVKRIFQSRKLLFALLFYSPIWWMHFPFCFDVLLLLLNSLFFTELGDAAGASSFLASGSHRSLCRPTSSAAGNPSQEMKPLKTEEPPQKLYLARYLHYLSYPCLARHTKLDLGRDSWVLL